MYAYIFVIFRYFFNFWAEVCFLRNIWTGLLSIFDFLAVGFVKISFYYFLHAVGFLKNLFVCFHNCCNFKLNFGPTFKILTFNFVAKFAKCFRCFPICQYLLNRESENSKIGWKWKLTIIPIRKIPRRIFPTTFIT